MSQFELGDSFELDDSRYRIARADSRNLAIQKLTADGWRSISYHGNSHYSLMNGLLELTSKHYQPPADGDLLTAIAGLRVTTDRLGSKILAALDIKK